MSSQKLLFDEPSIFETHSLPLIVSDSIFENKYGSIRRKLVKKHYGLGVLDNTSINVQFKTLDRDCLRDITHLYTVWRDNVEYMPIRYTFKEPSFMNFANTQGSPSKWIDYYMAHTGLFACMLNDNPNCTMAACEKLTSNWALKESCKRGNKVYIDMVHKKFEPLFNSTNHKQFFSTTINKNRKRVRRTSMLYLTGTIAPQPKDRVRSNHYKLLEASYAWLNFGKFWNGFVSNLRQFFGRIDYIRAWHSQDNFYPHFHAIIIFHEFKFSAVRWKEKDGSYSWRVHNRQKHKGVFVRDRLKDAWKWGGLDIKCVDNSKKAVKDLIKYVTHDLRGGASDKTNAMVWYFGKQAYAISKRFMDYFNTSITKAEPSNDDLINASGVIKRSNSNKTLFRIEIFPILPHGLFDFSHQRSVLDPEDVPDPPPNVINYLDNYVNSCSYTEKTRDDGVIIRVYKEQEVF